MSYELVSFEPILAVARHKSRGKVAFALILAAFAFVSTFAVAEGAARAFFWLRRSGALPSFLPCLPAANLHEYQLWDGQRCVWRLKPNFMATLPESLENARKAGRVLGERHLRERSPELELPADGVLFRINSSGFKGPELDRSHSRPRILTIGDSCTFGTQFDYYSYPRSLERELRRRGIDVEVVNGGVEGYSPRQVLARIEDFKSLRPEVTLVYIGWNSLYSEPGLEEGLARSLATVRLLTAAKFWLAQRLLGAPQVALAAYQAPRHPDRDAAAVKRLDSWTPGFVGDVDQLLQEMGSVSRRVYVVTIPGLFRMDEDPSPRALEVGHLPLFTDNPFVLAKMAERYNAVLRRLAPQRNAEIIDLEAWGREVLQPADKYFFDSLHLYEEGQQMIGVHLAEILERSGILRTLRGPEA